MPGSKRTTTFHDPHITVWDTSLFHCEVKQASTSPSALLFSEFSPKQESGNTLAPAVELHSSRGRMWRERRGRVLPGQQDKPFFIVRSWRLVTLARVMERDGRHLAL